MSRAGQIPRGDQRPMPTLSNVTLCCIDTATPALSARAMSESARLCTFGRQIYFSDRDWGLPDAEFRRIPTITSKAQYSRFVLKELAASIETDFVLTVQYDGFVLDPGCWTDEFLAFDYVGAPWRQFATYRVGNGGFSLRSRRLLQALADPRIEVADEPEDILIGRTFRSYLEIRHGIRFPEPALAHQFSWEGGPRPCPHFGFHGLYLLDLVYHGAAFDEVVAQLSPYALASWQATGLALRLHESGAQRELRSLMARVIAHQNAEQVRAGVRAHGGSDAVATAVYEAASAPPGGPERPTALDRVKARRWFYRFELPDGTLTDTHTPPDVLPIHETRRTKLRDVLRTYVGDAARLRAIDFAAHEGFFSIELARHFGRVDGFDLRPDNVAAARLIAEALGVRNATFTQANLQEMAFEERHRADFVLIYGLLYHLEDPIRVLRLAAQLSRKHILLETQVFPYDVSGRIEDGHYKTQRSVTGVFALSPDYPDKSVGGPTNMCLIPSINALTYLLQSFGFKTVQTLPSEPDDYEQIRRGARVIIYAAK